MKIYQIVSHKGRVMSECFDRKVAEDSLSKTHPSYEAKIIEVEMTRGKWQGKVAAQRRDP